MESKLVLEKRKQIEANLEFVKQAMFAREGDSLNEYSADSDVYYLGIGNSKYLVLSHYNLHGEITRQGFDLWICEYSSSSDIGRHKAVSMTSLKHGFKIKDDEDLIKSHIPPVQGSQ